MLSSKSLKSSISGTEGPICRLLIISLFPQALYIADAVTQKPFSAPWLHCPVSIGNNLLRLRYDTVRREILQENKSE
jgi:hypothetical protein